MITQKELKKILFYNPKTGIFKWKISPVGRIKINDIAGSKHKKLKNIDICIKGIKYKAHRLAWLYMYGKFPQNQIDHINHVQFDNRIKNLRDVSDAENKRNKKMQSNNTSGVVGVCFNKQNKKWRSRIYLNGKQIHLGEFNDIKDALKSRKLAKIKYKYHENHE
ncbi:MAG: HNH endonuclease signature motif containing protein [Candidatus ainarchaeum sp.]|jgi:hypothetical protein|nr:HNH endonuclease signature motif containing protein [Clostridia bacterium]MDD4468201.1 HNH endonuclease signature motif containing protein [Candidatus ainarchaeum sp.]